MDTLVKSDTYSLAAKGIMKVLLYSDVFHYPLTLEEIVHRHPLKNITSSEIKTELDDLIEQQLVFEVKGFYMLENNPQYIERRLKGNEKAQKYLVKSKWTVQFLKYFPFVQSIFLSGSISKNYIDENSDIDYFVITKAHYLWIVRSLFVLFRRIGLMGSRKLFCFNYLIDETHLKTSHESFYIATEIVTLVPMYDEGKWNAFYTENQWIQQYYPNYPIQSVKETQKKWIKYVLEFPFRLIGGKRLNIWLMNQTKKRKIKLFGKEMFSDPVKLSNFQPHIAKDNMKPHYQSIMEVYHQKIQDFENRTQIVLG